MRNSKIFLNTAIIYLRDYQKEKVNIYKINQQEEAIKSFAQEYGYRIVEVFREDNVSAKTFDRPVFQEMITYIRSNKGKIKFLIVTNEDRLSINPSGLERFRQFLRRNGIKIISITRLMLKYTEEQAKPTV